jgi:uncharacterized protein (TIGR03435 family)
MISPAHWTAAWAWDWTGAWSGALIDHLWQSTIFTLAAWALAMALRHNQARTRYSLWLLASAKFLVPFSIFVAAGERLQLRMGAPVAQPGFSTLVENFAQPFLVSASGSATSYGLSLAIAPTTTTITAGHHHPDWIPVLLIAAWACGALLLLARWARSWRIIRAAAHAASPIRMVSGVPVLVTPTKVEPGVFGIVHPVLLLPRGIMERLNASQMDAILAHELCHVRRRDNLTAALHMVVEVLFWFHPAVWLIRAKLLEERERACDEAVLASSREAVVYAEGILNVCKFYVEAPLNCVSGVTGSDLKKRIARIMTEHVTRKLDLPRKVMLAVAAVLAIGLPVTFGFVHTARAQAGAQTQPPEQKKGIEGTWQATLHIPNHDLRTVLKITRTPAGALGATFYSIDQGGQGIPTTSIGFDGGVLKYGIQFADITYEGKISTDGNSITGTTTQGGNSSPLVFERATPDTEWAIPEPPAKIPPMAVDANPSFEVVTIKPTKPDEQRKIITVRGRELVVINFTLNDLIKFAYDVQEKQIVGGPDWMGSDKFDVNAQPDKPGMPSELQMKTMIQKMLADRFQFKFHSDKKEMSAYVLTVGKDGPKMTKNTGDPAGLPGLFFGPLGVLHVRNATMANFTNLLQATVLDRPVVDRTGLDGKWDFILKWTPDESQFAGMGIKVPPPTDTTDAPPPLFTAIQEQLDLKLDAEKTAVGVLMIDHVDHPSPN